MSSSSPRRRSPAWQRPSGLARRHQAVQCLEPLDCRLGQQAGGAQARLVQSVIRGSPGRSRARSLAVSFLPTGVTAEPARTPAGGNGKGLAAHRAAVISRLGIFVTRVSPIYVTSSRLSAGFRYGYWQQTGGGRAKRVASQGHHTVRRTPHRDHRHAAGQQRDHVVVIDVAANRTRPLSAQAKLAQRCLELPFRPGRRRDPGAPVQGGH